MAFNVPSCEVHFNNILSRVAVPVASKVFLYLNKEYLQVVRLRLPINSPWQMLQVMSSFVENKVEIEIQEFWVICFTCIFPSF